MSVGEPLVSTVKKTMQTASPRSSRAASGNCGATCRITEGGVISSAADVAGAASLGAAARDSSAGGLAAAARDSSAGGLAADVDCNQSSSPAGVLSLRTLSPRARADARMAASTSGGAPISSAQTVVSLEYCLPPDSMARTTAWVELVLSASTTSGQFVGTATRPDLAASSSASTAETIRAGSPISRAQISVELEMEPGSARTAPTTASSESPPFHICTISAQDSAAAGRPATRHRARNAPAGQLRLPDTPSISAPSPPASNAHPPMRVRPSPQRERSGLCCTPSQKAKRRSRRQRFWLRSR